MDAAKEKPRSRNQAVSRSTKKAFSLIEAAIVLGVVGLVIGTIWVATAAVRETMKVNELINGVTSTVKNIQNLISMSDSETIGNYVEINSAVKSAGCYPKNWMFGTIVKNPFGGAMDIVNYVNPPRFGFSVWRVPRSACIALTSKISALGSIAGNSDYYKGNSLGYIRVSDLSWNPLFNAGTNTFPVTLAQATAACTGSDLFNVTFTFGYTRINN